MWTVTKTQNEHAYLEDLIRQVINDRPVPFPFHDQRIGHVDTYWEQVEPRVAFIASNPATGTSDDRRLAEAVIVAQLQPYGFKQANWSLRPDLTKTADWNDVMDDAKRIVQSGGVQIRRNSANTILGTVQGQGTGDQNQGPYNVEISRADPNSQAITGSHCDCDWGQFQNLPRTRTWKRFQNRPCKHIMATWWVSSAMPLDEDRAPGNQGEPGQMSLFDQSGGQAPGSMGLMQQSPWTNPNAWFNAPGTQPFAQSPPQGTPGQAPSPEDALPQFPMEGGPPPLPEVNPVSVPGGRPGPTPTDPVQYPGGTFSTHRPNAAIIGPVSASAYYAAQSYNNGDVVLLLNETLGNQVGRPESGEGGTPSSLQYDQSGQPMGVNGGELGQPITVPRGAVAEVMGTDPITSMVNCLWMGRAFDPNGIFKPYGATFWAFADELRPSKNKPPGPAIRRT